MSSEAHISRATGWGLVVAVALAYANSVHAPFVYDDVPAILENDSIRRWATAWSPPPGVTVSGRPLVNATLALNYALSGYRVWSYHAVNIAIHAAATALLFGIVRRTLQLPVCAARFGAQAAPLAGATAALWGLHPLATESITYVVQRAEALMGLCYLGTLYAFIRSARAGGGRLWQGLSVGVCALGMLSKEVMVSAPLLVILYDRTFLAGSFREAWRARRGYYLGLASTWLPLAWLVAAGGGNRGGTVGFGSAVGAWDYWLTQGDAIIRYLVLSIWPYPLVFEYGPFLVTLGEALPFLAVTAALAGATFVALRRASWAGFLGLWFFALLAPTSLMPGTTQMIVEHRMYLPLAAVSVVIVLALHTWLGRGSFLPLAGLAAALALATVARNQDYRSELALWSATVAERPRNALAHANLGIAYVRLGRVGDALRHYEIAARLGPRYPATHYNHGLALVQAGRREDALAAFLRATTLKADFAPAQAEAGLLLLHLGRNSEAIACCEQALRVNPGDAGTHCTLANALFLTRRVDEAFDHYGTSLRLAPDSADTHYNRGNSLYLLGRWTEAAEDYRRALLLRPEFPEARRNLEIAQARLRSAR